MEGNCKKCIRFITCRFVEANFEHAKSEKMRGMFSTQSNNLLEIFYSNADRCAFYAPTERDIDVVMGALNNSKEGLLWIRDYLQGATSENMEHRKLQAIDVINKYIDQIVK